MRSVARVFGAILLIGLLEAAYMYSVAVRDPIVRRADVQMPDWPAGAPPIRVALLTDVHVAGPDMPPTRLSRIVDQVNALRPDLVLLGGDLVSDKGVATTRYSGAKAIAPFRALRARLGTVAVLGNHDHWRGVQEIAAALAAVHIHLLVNSATRVGPLSVGGADDAYTGSDDVGATVREMRNQAGAKLLLSHSLDVVPSVPNDVTLILAGHTHCGQIRLPLIGAVSYMSRYGDRFACGIARDGEKRVIVSAGLGTSLLPFRLGAVPDLWLITLGPPNSQLSRG